MVKVFATIQIGINIMHDIHNRPMHDFAIPPQTAVREIIAYLGEDVNRSGLIDTPDRVVRSFKELYKGYSQSVDGVLKVFDEPTDEMVVLNNIEFYSMCEHHMLPFFGKAHIGYLPDGKVIGVSKLARILDIYARRLQIQERLGIQVVEALMDHLKPKGAGIIIEAQHFCMICRGVNKQNSVMKTSSLRGVFRDDPATRAEFLSLIGKG
jgi:GTP cyclohydrolase IA